MAWFRSNIASSGGGGGTPFLPSTDGVQFNTEIIRLPFSSNANYRIKVEFYVAEYVNDMDIVGNTYRGYTWFHLTQYNNRWYSSSGNGSGEFNFVGGLTGWHTYDYNNDSYVYFDDVQVVNDQQVPITVNPADRADNYYTIGYRGNRDFIGKIKRFTIWNNTDDSLVCDLQAYGPNGNAYCLYDVVNNKIYAPQPKV